MIQVNTPEPAFAAYAAVVGPAETVFDWSVDSCEEIDVPDLSARAFVDSKGQVQLIATIAANRRNVGPDLNNLTHQCDVIMRSDGDPDPSHFNDSEWIGATYTEDGQTIHALVHNEYHGMEHPGQCPQNDSFLCWYNAITQVVSTDGGVTYTHLPGPEHLVASLPYPYEAGAGPYGLMEPSNILKGRDGYYYAMVGVDGYASPDQHVCLMRTDDISRPDLWRAWDGAGFDFQFVNPYAAPIESPKEKICAAISYDQINNMHTSITYNDYLDKYVLIGQTGQNTDSGLVWGYYYSFSDDLIHWTDRQLLIEMPLAGVLGYNGPDVFAYPSLLDPESDSRNFDTAGKDAYIYYTHFRVESGAGFWDRDLERFPVEFFKSEEEARAADVRTKMKLNADLEGDNLLLKGELATLGNLPIEGAAIEFRMTPQGGPGVPMEYTITGIVPAGAKEASGGVRINSECNCAGTADVSIYEISYTEVGDTGPAQKRSFASGLAGSVWGTGDVKVGPSDQGSGKMLHFNVLPNQDARYNASHFSVKSGQSYTFTVKARVAPGSEGSGFFTLIFLGGSGEIERLTIPLAPADTNLGSIVTGPDGSFEFTVFGLGNTSTKIKASFSGDNRFWPSSVEDHVP